MRDEPLTPHRVECSQNRPETYRETLHVALRLCDPSAVGRGRVPAERGRGVGGAGGGQAGDVSVGERVNLADTTDDS